jgi:hypothetical protein
MLKTMLVSIHQKYFAVSVIEIIGMIEKKSLETDITALDMSVKTNAKLHRNHSRLRVCCDSLRTGFSGNDGNGGYDQSRIIKKIYKTLTNNLNKLDPEPSIDLFLSKNENGETITIIPGLDIGLIISNFTDDEKNILWNHIYMMYISSVAMISASNNHTDNRIHIVLPRLKDRIVKSGLTIGKDRNAFNPFIELDKMEELGDYDVTKMYTN